LTKAWLVFFRFENLGKKKKASSSWGVCTAVREIKMSIHFSIEMNVTEIIF